MKIEVTLKGRKRILLNRFSGQSSKDRSLEECLYLDKDGDVCLTTEMIYSFLFCGNPQGAIRFIEKKKGNEFCRFAGAYLDFPDDNLYYKMRNENGEVIKSNSPKIEPIKYLAPRTKLGSLSIKQNFCVRPAIKAPWFVSFTFDYIPNDTISIERVYNWFVSGGSFIGLGSNRVRFGAFGVDSFIIDKDGERVNIVKSLKKSKN